MIWKIAFFIQLAMLIGAMIGWHISVKRQKDLFMALEYTMDNCGDLSFGAD